MKNIFISIALLVSLNATAATPFTDLKCASVDKVYNVLIFTDEGSEQQVTITRSQGADVRQTNYMNFKKDEVLTQVAAFDRGIYSAALGIAGEDHSVSSRFQIAAIPGTIKVTSSVPQIASFDAIIPARSTFLPEETSTNSKAIVLKCSIELIQ